ncbi:MAG: hypothetical protein NZO16_04110 [Deltaproteobacteria bacterium]|nr:hypothetical protein [Deltaproteobacteria bacterium]
MNLLSDKNAVFNNFTLLDLFFPYTFVNSAHDSSVSTRISFDKVQRLSVKNHIMTVLARTDFNISEYGSLTLYWGGKWNEIRNSQTDNDFRAHHVGIRYSPAINDGMAWWLGGTLHYLDAKEIDRTTLGSNLGTGVVINPGVGELHASLNGYFKIDEDILAYNGDSTIRSLNAKLGYSFLLGETDELGFGLSAISAKLGKASLSRYCPSLEYQTEILSIKSLVGIDYCFASSDDNVSDLDAIVPVLFQDSQNGSYLAGSVKLDIDIGRNFRLYPSFLLYQVDLDGWGTSIEFQIPFN